MMRRFSLLLSLILTATALHAQSFWDSSVRLAPGFYAYSIKAPFNEKITEVSFPMYVSVPLLAALSVDVGTAFATAHVENSNTGGTSDMSGLTDTQVRANYTVGQDFLVLTAGVNLPTGS